MLTTSQWSTEQAHALEAARCLLAVGDAPSLLAALARWQYRCVQPLYADLAARLPLTPEQWAQVPAPCAGLLWALPAVLARSEAEAAALVRHLPVGERRRLQVAVLVLGRAGMRTSAPLPAPIVERLLFAALGIAA